jgi:hypothetical protein
LIRIALIYGTWPRGEIRAKLPDSKLHAWTSEAVRELHHYQRNFMRYKTLIDGKLLEGAGTIGVEEPATGMVFEQCPIADGAHLNRAVAAAKAAFSSWAKRSYVDAAHD